MGVARRMRWTGSSSRARAGPSGTRVPDPRRRRMCASAAGTASAPGSASSICSAMIAQTAARRLAAVTSMPRKPGPDTVTAAMSGWRRSASANCSATSWASAPSRRAAVRRARFECQ
ncbi:hypothetical protein IOD13_05565 [Brevibacterium casei]|nr:hypothetical protein [Brevibacterium casei]